MIADPTDDEESLCLGKLTIVMNEEKICCIHKPGIFLYVKLYVKYIIIYKFKYNYIFKIKNEVFFHPKFLIIFIFYV